MLPSHLYKHISTLMNPFEPCFLVFGSLVLVFLVWVQCGEVALLDMLNPFAIHPNQM